MPDVDEMFDDGPRLGVLDHKVRCRLADQLERCRIVQRDNCLPLLVVDFVNGVVPRIAGIVHKNMNLAAAKRGCLLHETSDALVVGNVAADSKSCTAVCSNCLGCGFRLFTVNIGNHDLAAFAGELERRLGTNALCSARDDCRLA